MFTRRSILMTGGAAALIGGAVTSVGIAHGPGLGEARAPWTQAGESFGDPRIDALAYAILAPNPHNRQPWQFDLVAEDRIDVYVDLERRLPHTDPFDRQITIGFGCMLELLRIAAAERGYEVTLTPFPDGDAYPRLNGNRIAQVTFAKRADLKKDPLFANILARRSTKEPYDKNRPVAPATLDAVIADGQGALSIGGTLDAAQRDRIIDLAWRGFNIEMETDITRRESVDLMRIGNRAIVENPDGIDMGGIPMGLFKMAGIVSHKGLDTPGSTAYNEGLKMYDPIIHSAQGFVWIKADTNTRLTQLQAGRAWVRMNLSAQKAGLCMHPLSQVLQEFPEMAEPYEAMRAELNVTFRRRCPYAWPRGLCTVSRSQSALASGEQADKRNRMNDADTRSLIFALFNEIGIINQLSTARFARVLAPDLNPSEFGVLNHFVRVRDQSSPSRLAKAFQMTKPSMTAILAKLERKGYVEIVGSAEDRRKKIVSITKSGREARQRGLDATAPLAEILMAAQDVEALAKILPTLQALREFLDAERNAVDGLS